MSKYHFQKGQAYAELLVSFAILGLFLFGSYHLWRYAEARQLLIDTARFVAWERTVWEPDDNAVEMHALHRSDESLAREAVVHQLSTPETWRRERSGVTAAGAPADIPAEVRRGLLKPALRSFVGENDNPNKLLTVSTLSEMQTGIFVGRDPSGNTTTSLSLDREVLRTVAVSMKSSLTQSSIGKLFGFWLPNLESDSSLSLITNSWAASPPVNRIRTARQLNVMSTGESFSGTKPNFLAYFGQTPDSGALGASDFFGMAPWWDLVAGQNGFGGQYVVKQIGLDAGAVNNIIQTQKYAYDPSKSVAGNILLQAQIDQREYMQPNSVGSSFPRAYEVRDNTADASEKPARNSVAGGKRKYMATSLQNPVENYF